MRIRGICANFILEHDEKNNVYYNQQCKYYTSNLHGK